ncbi:MAG TPA: alpha/beta hydrolase [Planctomycetota bacterium]|nr:alpha/beta hydrolase [Planctomycetota bacterium]
MYGSAGPQMMSTCYIGAMDITSFRVASRNADLACVRFGEGPPLLLAHPVLFSKAFYVAAADVWGGRFSCVAYDQRCHGETTSSMLTPADLAADIGAILDHLKWDKATIGGTSFGAASTLLFALSNPARVTTLIQDLPGFGPGTFRDPFQTSRIAAALEDADLDDAAKQITMGMSEPRAKAWTEALFADWKNYDAATIAPKMAGALRAASSWRIVGRWPDELQKLTMPVRIFGVQGDTVHPWDTAQTMARTIKGARLSQRVQSLSSAAIAHQWVDALTS